ncbi:alpha/beta fold hydrolase [Siccirubricoccus phaeus]|uniref:alpha/beta fold hydrolase n=1 Tax=Siccirubricoccus phaeus TaxID=2595053 RepID=UPI001F1D9FBE|nr:alpha/beta fold hydrolase [Siccirubricoccus phaeus]
MTPRRGPRPLPLHLSLAGMRRVAALAALPLLGPAGMCQGNNKGSNSSNKRSNKGSPPSSPGSPSWNPAWPRSSAGRQEMARIAAALAAGGHRAEAFQEAVLRVLARQDAALIGGIAAYRRQAPPEGPPPPPAIWTEGGSALRDYGGHGGAGGPALLVVPSLVNRARVLDLLPDSSCLRFLAASGARPLLLEWGEPGALERGFTLTDYIAGRLERALAAAVAATGGKVVLVGYCMGGLLALAAAQRCPDRVAALALWAVPWDFWAGGAAEARALAATLPALEPLLELSGALPVEALQALFALPDPFGVAAKYRGFARLDPEGPAARRFGALEDWLNDGVPLVAPVARECLAGWYGANSPARGVWRVAGEAVSPARLGLPAFLAVPSRDRIVPPASALALARLLPGAALHRAAAGHVGMVAGRGAEAALWRPFLAWLRQLHP